MALQSAMSVFRTSVLRHLRIVAASPLQQTTMPSLPDVVVRAFGGGVLDRDSVTQRVVHVAKHFEKVDPAKLSPTASFEKDLGLDSLDVVELVMALEEEFGVEIPDTEADKISSVKDAVDYMLSNPIAK